MKSSTIARLIAAAIVLFFFVFLTVLTAKSQVTVSGNVKDLGGGACGKNCEIRARLWNCGDNTPTVPGVATGGGNPSPAPVNAATGAFSFTLYGNDQISCGGITDATRWLLGVYINNKLYGVEMRYWIRFADGGIFNPANRTPENGQAPPPAGNDCAIRNGSNQFRGTQDFSLATVVGITSTGNLRRFIPSESPDGARLTFTIGVAPADSLSFTWYWNGQQLMDGDDYTVSGNVVTMTRAPKSGDKVWAVF
ncbi:MAG TPA: hypothetical protein VN577_20095 [Terriglobales bacterium]|nr:hypothetical protein [Terriglobales bacterium]